MVAELVSKFDAEVWVKAFLYTNRSPKKPHEAARLACLLADHGGEGLEQAGIILRGCVKFCERPPEVHGSSYLCRIQIAVDSRDRQDLAQFDQIRQRRRELACIREVIGCLFGYLQGERRNPFPTIPESCRLDVVDVLASHGLVNDDLPWNAPLVLSPVADQLSIQQIQKILGELVAGLFRRLVHPLMILLEGEPCRFSILGLGSLAREEMNPFSDLDAVVVVERSDENVIDHFQRLGNLVDLQVRSLGESKCEIGQISHLDDQFALDPAMLHPAKMIETSEGILRIIEEEIQSLESGADLRPCSQALRLTCSVMGSDQFHAQHQTKLRAFLAADRRGRRLGQLLLERWQAPEVEGHLRDAKRDLYRPITLLIDALNLLLGDSDASSTTERLEDLRGRVPDEFVAICERALELACRLRMEAQLHYGEEIETVYLQPPPDQTNPLILSCADRITLREVEATLFKPLGSMDLKSGIDFGAWQKARIDFARELVREHRMTDAGQVLQSVPEVPPELASTIARWNGAIEGADIAAHHMSTRLQHLKLEFLLWRHQLGEGGWQLLDRLIGRLEILREDGYRRSTPNPGRAIFLGDSRTRRAELYRFLTSIDACEEFQNRLWETARALCRRGSRLPVDNRQLYSDLSPTEEIDPNSLLYGDILALTRDALALSHHPAFVRYLYALTPPCLQDRLVTDLRQMRLPITTLASVVRLPSPSGARHLYRGSESGWSVLCLIDDANPSSATVAGVRTPKAALSKGALDAIGQLTSSKKGKGCRHSVLCYGNTYLKDAPEFPGKEEAYLKLSELVTGEARPRRELIRVDLEGTVHAISASEKIAGPTLDAALLDTPELLDLLDMRHYSLAVLMTILTLPEDAKDGNIICHQQQPGRPVQLIDVDAERSFYSEMTVRRYLGRLIPWGQEVQCKSALLCLDQMKRPIDEEARREFLLLDPVEVLDICLTHMQDFNVRCMDLFGREFIDGVMKGQMGSEIPFYPEATTFHEKTGRVHKGLAVQLFERFTALQQALRKNPTIKLISLLGLVTPDLGELYGSQLARSVSPRDRFRKITLGLYKATDARLPLETTTVLPRTHLTSVDFEEAHCTVENAKKELCRIQRAPDELRLIVEELLYGDGDRIESPKDPTLIDRALERIDISRLPPSAQRRLLQRITGHPFQRLCLRRCQVLSNQVLDAILSHSPDLRLLDLSETTGVTSLAFLGDRCPCLGTLYLRGIRSLGSLSSSTTFTAKRLCLPQLRDLDISNAPKLSSLLLEATKLKRLVCTGTSITTADAYHLGPLHFEIGTPAFWQFQELRLDAPAIFWQHLKQANSRLDLLDRLDKVPGLPLLSMTGSPIKLLTLGKVRFERLDPGHELPSLDFVTSIRRYFSTEFIAFQSNEKDIGELVKFVNMSCEGFLDQWLVTDEREEEPSLHLVLRQHPLVQGLYPQVGRHRPIPWHQKIKRCPNIKSVTVHSDEHLHFAIDQMASSGVCLKHLDLRTHTTHLSDKQPRCLTQGTCKVA